MTKLSGVRSNLNGNVSTPDQVGLDFTFHFLERGPFGETDGFRARAVLVWAGSCDCRAGSRASGLWSSRLCQKVQSALFRLSRGLAEAQQFRSDIRTTDTS